MKLKIIIILLLTLVLHQVYAQNAPNNPLAALGKKEKISDSVSKESFIYAVKDSNQLGLDVYKLKMMDFPGKRPCLIFVFGGAFVFGTRDDSIYNHYFNALTKHGIVVVSISYRLGMRGIGHVSKFNIKPLRNAVTMAVGDLYDATRWVLAHTGELGIDSSMILVSGSSSGAITALESDYWKRNDNPASAVLPKNFEYAGVIAFSGAIMGFDWGLRYKIPPAPTMLFHGSGDQIVPYKKVAFLNKGFYGSEWIAKVFLKKDYPHYFYSETHLGHEVSVMPMYLNMPIILDFIDRFVVQKIPLQIDTYYNDPEIKPMMTMSAEQMFEKLSKEHR